MIPNVYLNWFIEDDTFPFYIQYGTHDDDLFIHTHGDFVELVVILSGTATHIVDEEEYPIKKGDVFVINEKTSHGYKNPKNFRICNIMFRLPYFLDYQNDIRNSPGFHALFIIEPMLTRKKGFQGQLSLNMEEFDIINHLLQTLFQEYSKQEIGYQTMITSLMSQMFTTLSRLYNPKDHDNKQIIVSIANAVSYIENHYDEELSIEMLAQLAAMSSRHFRRTFQSIYNISPLKYITILRIQAAMKLLRDSDLSVTEIALRCGYADANYFSNKFKTETGKNPLAYRKYARELLHAK